VLHNVLVFSLGHARWALELRWVREVERMGNITPVPGAPPAIAGLINLRGQIFPVLAPTVLPLPIGGEVARAIRRSDQAILVDLDGVQAALPADRIDEVTSLEADPEAADTLCAEGGRRLRLIDPPALLIAVRHAVETAAATLAANLWGPL
jgi:purine-binding chemotaxis protein CheW